MQVYLGQRLLKDHEILSVEEANSDKLKLKNCYPETIYSRPGKVDFIRVAEICFSSFSPSFWGKEGEKEENIHYQSLCLITRDIYASAKEEYLADIKFLVPGRYRVTSGWVTLDFSVIPSGKIYKQYPALLRLPKDLLTVIANSGDLKIGQIWDLETKEKPFCTPYFWRNLTSMRLTNDSTYFNHNLTTILADLHYLDTHPLVIKSYTDIRKETIDFWLRFDKLREQCNNGKVFHFIEANLANFQSDGGLFLVHGLGMFPSRMIINIINDYLQRLFPGITKIPDDIYLGKLAEQISTIYQEIITKFLTGKQIYASLVYLKTHPLDISPKLISKLIEYVEDPRFRKKLER